MTGVVAKGRDDPGVVKASGNQAQSRCVREAWRHLEDRGALAQEEKMGGGSW